MKLSRINSFISGFFIFAVINTQIHADAALKTQPVDQDPIAVNNLIQLTLGMLVVLGLIMGLAWLAKRSGKFQIGAGGSLQILGGMSVGGRERVVLVQVGEQQLLVGVSPGSVRTLHVLDNPVTDSNNSAKGTQGFSEQIAQLMGKGKES